MDPHAEPTERTDEPHAMDADRVRSRANLLPEETAAGSDDPEAQAEAILEDSDRRVADPTAAPSSFVEHRTSDETA